MNQSELEQVQVISAERGKNACEQLARFVLAFFLSDWLRRNWRGLFKPIRERSKAQPMRIRHYF